MINNFVITFLSFKHFLIFSHCQHSMLFIRGFDIEAIQRKTKLVFSLSFVKMNLVLCQTLVWQDIKEVVQSLTSALALLWVRRAVLWQTWHCEVPVFTALSTRPPGPGCRVRVTIRGSQSRHFQAWPHYTIYFSWSVATLNTIEWLKTQAIFSWQNVVFLWSSKIKWNWKHVTPAKFKYFFLWNRKRH